MVKPSKLFVNNALVLLCDMQEKFRKTVVHFSDIILNTNKLLLAAKLLNVPIIVTEHYPKGLGNTVSELNIEGLKIYEKTQLSMCIDPICNYLEKNTNFTNIILCGIETHACIQQTALDLVDQHNVYVVCDATSSRSLLDRNVSLKYLSAKEINITTSESILLSLVRDASHPKFKSIQELIKNSSQNCDLLF